MTKLGIVPPSSRALASAFIPERSTPEGLQAWREAVTKHRSMSTKELDDIPKFLQLWVDRALRQELVAGELVKLALEAGLFTYTLRRSTFGVRCARFSELLGRIVLVQGEHGIVPGYRFARTGMRCRDARWVMEPVGTAKERVEAKERAVREREAAREAEMRQERARRAAKPLRGSRLMKGEKE